MKLNRNPCQFEIYLETGSESESKDDAVKSGKMKSWIPCRGIFPIIFRISICCWWVDQALSAWRWGNRSKIQNLCKNSPFKQKYIHKKKLRYCHILPTNTFLIQAKTKNKNLDELTIFFISQILVQNTDYMIKFVEKCQEGIPPFWSASDAPFGVLITF